MTYYYRSSDKTLDSARWVFNVYRGVASNLAWKDIDVAARFINDIGSDKITDPEHVFVGRSPGSPRADYKHKSQTSAFIPDELRPLAFALQKEADAFIEVFGEKIGFNFLSPESQERYKTPENFQKEYREARENHFHWREGEEQGADHPLSAYEKLNAEISKNYGRQSIANALKMLKAVSLAEMLRFSGNITQEVYSELMDQATLQADSIGLNGLHKMADHHPEIIEWLKNDDAVITVDQTGGKGHWPKVNKFKRGEYYTQHAEAPNITPEQRINALYESMGKSYTDAVQEKLDAIKSLSKLHPSFELDNIIDTPNHARGRLAPEMGAKVFLINNGIPMADERLRDLAMRQYGYKEEKVDLHPNQIEGDQSSRSGGHVKRLTSGKEESETQKKSPSHGRQGDTSVDSLISENKNPEKTSDQGKKDPDSFVTAGKIGSTAVLGTVLGASLLSMTKKPDEDKDSDEKSKKSKSNKRFIAAVAALASAAGIVLVWKYPDVAFGWLKRGGRSA
jgi:hypothetical protein